MKKLWFARHAKSSWDDPNCHDMQRPLLEKGMERTAKVVTYLNERGEKPERIISSPAVRALETARLLARGMGYPLTEIQIESQIYFGSEEQVWEVIFGLPDHIGSALLVGHNPTFTHMVNYFLKEKIALLPTSGLFIFSLETEKWEEVPVAPCRLEHGIFPKQIL